MKTFALILHVLFSDGSTITLDAAHDLTPKQCAAALVATLEHPPRMGDLKHATGMIAECKEETRV